MIKTEIVSDYSHPAILARDAMKKMHQMVLTREYDSAMEAAKFAIVEMRIMLNMINIMKEKEVENGLRK
jgi:hypothetical protein